MLDHHGFTRRLILAAGLTAAVLGATALGAASASADTPPRRTVPAIVSTPAGSADPAPQRGTRPATAAVASITPLQVQVGGTQATVTFSTSEPTAVTYELKVVGAPPPPSPPSGPLGGVTTLVSGSVATTGVTPPPAAFKTQHSIPLKNLKSNTTYDVFVAATTQSGQRLTGSARFTTLKLRVRVTLEDINVLDDGDTDYAIVVDNDAEPRWVMDLTLGGRLCYPVNCGAYAGNVKEGRFVPRDSAGNRFTWQLFEEVFNGLPNELTISVRTFEEDVFNMGACVGHDCDLNDNRLASATWRRPQGVESHTDRVQVRGDDGDGFRSVLTFTFEVFHDATPYVIN
jgi:hypothetical protein